MINVEVRGGEGGEDASLFAEQLTNSIFTWVQSQGLKTRYTSSTSLSVETDTHCL